MKKILGFAVLILALMVVVLIFAWPSEDPPAIVTGLNIHTPSKIHPIYTEIIGFNVSAGGRDGFIGNFNITWQKIGSSTVSLEDLELFQGQTLIADIPDPLPENKEINLSKGFSEMIAERTTKVFSVKGKVQGQGGFKIQIDFDGHSLEPISQTEKFSLTSNIIASKGPIIRGPGKVVAGDTSNYIFSVISEEKEEIDFFVTWGDASSAGEDLIATETNGLYYRVAQHTFAAPGIYSIEVMASPVDKADWKKEAIKVTVTPTTPEVTKRLIDQNQELKAEVEELRMPTVTGKVFADTNRNKALDPSDQPLQDMQIDLYKDGFMDPVASGKTDVNGIYVFNITPGRINGMGVRDTETWDVTWFANWPIEAENNGVYFGPLILLTRTERG